MGSPALQRRLIPAHTSPGLRSPCSLSGRAGLGNTKAVVPDTSPELSLGSVCQGGTDTCHPSLPRCRKYHSQEDVSSDWEAQRLYSARTTSVFSTELPHTIAFGQRGLPGKDKG